MLNISGHDTNIEEARLFEVSLKIREGSFSQTAINLEQVRYNNLTRGDGNFTILVRSFPVY